MVYLNTRSGHYVVPNTPEAEEIMRASDAYKPVPEKESAAPEAPKKARKPAKKA